MTAFRPKLWTGISAAVLLTAVTACSEAGDQAATGEPAAPPPAVGEGGEGGAEGGPGAGEAGAQSAYNAAPAESRAALRIAHLEGFFLIAQAQKEGPEYAAALAGQGMAEVYDAQPGAFTAAGVDEAVLRKAAQTGAPADIDAAIAELNKARAKADGDQAAIVKGLVDIAAGIYGEVNVDGAVDPIEYQHALGSALAAQKVAAGSDEPKVRAAKADIDKLVKMWPAPSAPETVDAITPAGQVSAQASRIELALS